MNSKLKRRDEMIVSLNGKVKGLEEREQRLKDELEFAKEVNLPKSPPVMRNIPADRSDSIIVFDASKIPVELSSSLEDLNDVFVALQETTAGKEAIQSLYETSPAKPISSEKVSGESLKNLVRVALSSPRMQK